MLDDSLVRSRLGAVVNLLWKDKYTVDSVANEFSDSPKTLHASMDSNTPF